MIELMASTLRELEALTVFDFAAAASPQGRAWLAAVPSVLDDLACRWHLTIGTDQVRHGYSSIVLPADQDGRPLALKLSWPPGQVRDEARALAAWRGHGVVELIACDVSRGALLLERLDAACTLASIPVAEAAAVAGALIRTLAIEPPGPFPVLQAAAHQLATTIPARQHALSDPLPGPWVTLAAKLAANLARDPARVMVHTDLHYENILAGRGWVAIDPSAALGAPERSTAELLWTRVDELPDAHSITALLDMLVEHGRLDHAKAVAWSFVRDVDYWLWALENGLTVDPLRCERVAGALAPLAAQSDRLSRPRRRPVAVQNLAAVGTASRAGAVWVPLYGPSPPVDGHKVVERAVQGAVVHAGRPAVGLMADVVHLTGRGRLAAPAGPLAMLVPQDHRGADGGRNRAADPDVQWHRRPGQPAIQLLSAQERGQSARPGQ